MTPSIYVVCPVHICQGLGGWVGVCAAGQWEEKQEVERTRKTEERSRELERKGVSVCAGPLQRQKSLIPCIYHGNISAKD